MHSDSQFITMNRSPEVSLHQELVMPTSTGRKKSIPRIVRTNAVFGIRNNARELRSNGRPSVVGISSKFLTSDSYVLYQLQVPITTNTMKKLENFINICCLSKVKLLIVALMERISFCFDSVTAKTTVDCRNNTHVLGGASQWIKVTNHGTSSPSSTTM